jgi:hypothetical protein
MTSIFAASGASGKLLGLGAGGAVASAVYSRTNGGSKDARKKSKSKELDAKMRDEGGGGWKDDDDADDDGANAAAANDVVVEVGAVAGRRSGGGGEGGGSGGSDARRNAASKGGGGGGGGGGVGGVREEEWVEHSVELLDRSLLPRGGDATQLAASSRRGKVAARARSGSGASSSSSTPQTMTMQKRTGQRGQTTAKAAKTTTTLGESLSLWLRIAAPLILAAARRLLRARSRRAGGRGENDDNDDGGGGDDVGNEEEDKTKFPELEAIREMGRAMRAEGRPMPKVGAVYVDPPCPIAERRLVSTLAPIK